MINRLFGLSGGLGPSPGATGGRRETRPNLSLRKMIQVAVSRRMEQEQDKGQRPRRLAACEVGQREGRGRGGVRGWGCSVLTRSSQGPCQQEGAEAGWGEGGGDHDPSQPGPKLRLGVGRGAANTLNTESLTQAYWISEKLLPSPTRWQLRRSIIAASSVSLRVKTQVLSRDGAVTEGRDP